MKLRSLSRLALVPAAIVGLALVMMVVAAPAAHAAGGYIQVTGGLFHTCAILSVDDSGAGPVQCWGDNSFGQSAAPGGSFKQITAGDYHTCGLKPDGSVQCWGSNEKFDFCDVEGGGQCYYDWTGQATPPTGFTAQQISAGAYYTCGVTGGGKVVCWGLNSHGEADERDGNYVEVTTGVDHTCARKAGGGVDCWGNDKYGKASPPTGVNFKAITAGDNHTCGIKTDGNVACWGGNTWGQAPDYRAGPDAQISAGDLFNCAVRAFNGALDCWGYNFYGQVNQAPAGEFKQVGAGGGHACAIRADGTIACWGRNDHGQATPGMPGTPPGRFAFSGFYPPLAPTTAGQLVLNVVKAGSSVPLKFSVGGDKGLQVIAAGFPVSVQFDCGSRDRVGDPAATNTAGRSSLSYDPSSGTYAYVWDTEKAWSGTCRVLAMRLADGSWHMAAFHFK
jgi:hypothetical protein